MVCVSTASLLPGCGLASHALQQIAPCSYDMSTEVPGSRWEQSEATAALATRVPAMRHGGFLRDIEGFDNGFFGVAPAEASVMDPQQRLLLEQGYTTLHGAGERKQVLMGSGVGVYVGVWACEFTDVLSHSPLGNSVHVLTAATCSVVVGRVSFALGLVGPCVSYDTACSSGLVASHAGARALQYAECATALAAGVNMLFSPRASMVIGAAGMTCADAI